MPRRPRLIRQFSLALIAACAAGPAAADITIGAAGPLQGQYAAFGEQLRHGAQQAVDDINASGGVNGEKLVLRMADDSCDPRKAIDVANQFVAAGVKFVAGHYCSGSSMPAAKIYEQAGIVEISPASTLPKFTEQGGWNVLRTCPRDDAQGTIAGNYVAARFAAARIAILADQAPADKALAGKVKGALGANGITAALSEDFIAGGKDYSALARKLADAGIDAVYFAGAYPEAGLLLKELDAIGHHVQMISDDALVTEEFWNVAGDLGEGTLMTFPPDPLKTVAAQPLIQRFKDAGFVPEGYTLNAYAAVQAWVQAAEATAGTDPRAIASWLRAGNTVKTVLGDIRFDAKGDLVDPRYVWFRWSQGRYSEVTAP